MTVGGHGVRGYKVTEEGVQRRINVFNRMWENGHEKFVLKAENHPRALLSNEEVRGIIDLLIKKEHTIEGIAEIYNINKSVVSSIKKGSSYKTIITRDEVESMNRRSEGEPKRIKDLTEEDVLNLKRDLLTSDMLTTKIYNNHEVTGGVVNYILYRSKFSYLFTEDEIKKIRNRKNNRFLTIEEVVKIKELLEEDLYSNYEIALIFNVKATTIRSIKTGHNWSNVLIDLPMEDIETYEWKYIDWKPQKPNHKF